ncbi:hypothetical protein PMIT1313_02633 [Prochlorococcus marinus str. MIT 1313]|nr:hypothetical protein PMIT1313_02633 [Prochlorococcus marinus str. MIT 1313]KZR77948.1 hypothetical protein PMIT1318_00031 [Prochlorococcus marinus str. MIT 1318]
MIVHGGILMMGVSVICRPRCVSARVSISGASGDVPYDYIRQKPLP